MDVPEIDIVAAADRHAGGAPFFDVREPDEYVAGHVPGATSVPLGQVAGRVAEFPGGVEVLVICRSGARSAQACEILRSAGVEAVNVAGGTMAWIEAGNRVVEGADAGTLEA